MLTRAEVSWCTTKLYKAYKGEKKDALELSDRLEGMGHDYTACAVRALMQGNLSAWARRLLWGWIRRAIRCPRPDDKIREFLSS